MNDLGQVVGTSTNAAHVTSAFLYDHGAVTDLGTLGGTDTEAYAINNHGQIVGTSRDGGGTTRAFLYDHGAIASLGSLSGGETRAFDINESGQIAGDSFAANGERRGVIFSGGAITDIGSLGGSRTNAFGINEAGDVVGQSRTGTSVESTRAILYSGGALTDLGTFGGLYADAQSINDNGVIIGSYIGQDIYSAYSFVYQNGIETLLPTLGNRVNTAAIAINNSGQIVGSYQQDNDGRAFLYENGVEQDLNALIDPALGWTLVSADDINEAGQIVGTGLIGGREHAFLLTPVAVAVPEPSTWTMLLAGFGALGATLRRRKRPVPFLSAPLP